MATYSVTQSTHQTLASSTVDTVNLAAASLSLTLRNRGATDIYYTFGAGGGTAATPAVASESYICPAGSAVRIDGEPGGISQVKLFSTGTPAYSVEGF